MNRLPMKSLPKSSMAKGDKNTEWPYESVPDLLADTDRTHSSFHPENSGAESDGSTIISPQDDVIQQHPTSEYLGSLSQAPSKQNNAPVANMPSNRISESGYLNLHPMLRVTSRQRQSDVAMPSVESEALTAAQEEARTRKVSKTVSRDSCDRVKPLLRFSADFKATPLFPLTGYSSAGFNDAASDEALDAAFNRLMKIQDLHDRLNRFAPRATQASQRGRRAQASRRNVTKGDATIEPTDTSKKLRDLKNQLVFSQPADGRKKRRLLTQLVKDGCVMPRGPTHPIHSVRKQSPPKENHAPNRPPAVPIRPFLVPSGDVPENILPPRPPPKKTPPGFQPERESATEATPFHQLYYPSALRAACKMNEHKWNDKAMHSDKAVFVFVRQVDNDIADMLVFESLREANVYALHAMAKKHPSAFAVPREGPSLVDGDNVKAEEPERAQSVLRKLRHGRSHARKDREVVTGGDERPRIKNENAEEEEELASMNRCLPDARPGTGEVRREDILGTSSEAKYLYWGEWKFTACCLKMEARQRDGTRVKIFVSLKNLRKLGS
ncbi:hypothetical protein F4779DRAFT_239380 [Xylariaceae sp. FL0662B]|nr:hypothetical protein F4779DRAFT_239380 [Xylariaceae sp. FL0662B]